MGLVTTIVLIFGVIVPSISTGELSYIGYSVGDVFVIMSYNLSHELLYDKLFVDSWIIKMHNAAMVLKHCSVLSSFV